MKEKLVSIIMPVYNTGEVLRKTIDSIISQSYINWELLLIDDGSTDQSAAICDEYAYKDERIYVFHKINGGVCDARNLGLDKANGEFITFCDHDDEYTVDLLTTAVNRILQYPNCAYVGYGYSVISDDGFVVEYSTFDKVDHILVNISDNYLKLYENQNLNTVWAKLFRTSFIKSNNLYFDVSYKFGGEDLRFNTEIAKLNPKVLFISDILYKHYLRKSLSTSASVHLENQSLFINQMRDVNSVIESLEIDIAKNLVEYIKIFSMLLHVHISYLTFISIPYSQKIKRCEEFSAEDKSNMGLCWKAVLVLFKSNRINSTVYFLHKMKAYSVLYFLFDLSNKYKRLNVTRDKLKSNHKN